MNIGGGTGGTGKSSKKRAREEDEEWETDDQQAVSDEEMDENGAGVRGKARRQERRVEMNGQKKVNKEVFRKGENSQRQKSTGVQWSR